MNQKSQRCNGIVCCFTKKKGYSRVIFLKPFWIITLSLGSEALYSFKNSAISVLLYLDYFCDFIKPRVPSLTTQFLPSKALAAYRTCAEDTVVKLRGAHTCSSEPGSCRKKPNRPEFFIPRTDLSAPLFEPLPNCSSKPKEAASWIKTENVHPFIWKLRMCASTFYRLMAVGGESPWWLREQRQCGFRAEEGMHSSLIEAFWEWMVVEIQLQFSAGWLSYFNQLEAITVQTSLC